METATIWYSASNRVILDWLLSGGYPFLLSITIAAIIDSPLFRAV